MSGLFAPLLPPFVASAEGVIDEIDGPIWPEEAERVARAVEQRRKEFRAGRTLARQALAAVGARACGIGASEAGAPVWPDGFVGSISHTGPMVWAVAARRSDVRTIGVDLEAIARFSAGIERRVLTSREIRNALAGLAGAERQAIVATVFSAKEAFYKMQHPISGRRLGFQDAEVAVDAAGGRFELTLLSPAAPFAAGDRFWGRWGVRSGLVAAAIWLSDEGRP